jgi:hypothetical protein
MQIDVVMQAFLTRKFNRSNLAVKKSPLMNVNMFSKRSNRKAWRVTGIFHTIRVRRPDSLQTSTKIVSFVTIRRQAYEPKWNWSKPAQLITTRHNLILR